MDERRLREVEDRLAILDLEGRYARAFDSRDGEAWAALFTEDGVYQGRGYPPDSPGRPTGRAQLAAYCSDAAYDGLHLLHVPEIVIDGDEARSRVHLEFRATIRDDGRPIDMSGYYDVRYRRVDGDWLIAHRITTTLRIDGGPVTAYLPGTAFDDED